MRYNLGSTKCTRKNDDIRLEAAAATAVHSCHYGSKKHKQHIIIIIVNITIFILCYWPTAQTRAVSDGSIGR